MEALPFRDTPTPVATEFLRTAFKDESDNGNGHIESAFDIAIVVCNTELTGNDKSTLSNILKRIDSLAYKARATYTKCTFPLNLLEMAENMDVRVITYPNQDVHILYLQTLPNRYTKRDKKLRVKYAVPIGSRTKVIWPNISADSLAFTEVIRLYEDYNKSQLKGSRSGIGRFVLTEDGKLCQLRKDVKTGWKSGNLRCSVCDGGKWLKQTLNVQSATCLYIKPISVDYTYEACLSIVKYSDPAIIQ